MDPPAIHSKLRKGVQLRVEQAWTTDALIAWKAPATTSVPCIIPPGTILEINYDVQAPRLEKAFKRVSEPQGEPGIAYVAASALDLLGMRREVESHPEIWEKVTEWVPSAVGCYPANYAELEASIVPASSREHPKYNGYWLSVPIAEIGTKFTLLE